MRPLLGLPSWVYNSCDFHSITVSGGDTQHYVYREETIERGSLASWFDFETRQTRLWASALPFLFKRPCTDHFSFLVCGFFSYKVFIIRESFFQGWWEDKKDDVYELPGSAPGIQKFVGHGSYESGKSQTSQIIQQIILEYLVCIWEFPCIWSPLILTSILWGRLNFWVFTDNNVGAKREG